MRTEVPDAPNRFAAKIDKLKALGWTDLHLEFVPSEMKSLLHGKRPNSEEIEQVPSELADGEPCPNCPDQGWYVVPDLDGEPEQCQCEFCYTNPNSVFNLTSDGEKKSVTSKAELDCHDLLRDSEKMVDVSCDPSANIEHLQNVLVGYRDYIRNRSARSDFSPDGARDTSWKLGRDLARLDLGEVGE